MVKQNWVDRSIRLAIATNDGCPRKGHLNVSHLIKKNGIGVHVYFDDPLCIYLSVLNADVGPK